MEMSVVRSFLPSSARDRGMGGFSLIELAIVLGVVGLVLGAIWAAAASVYQKNRIKLASEQVLQIVTNWRGVYSGKRVDLGNNVDITPESLQNGFIPASMLVGAPPNVVSPWGSPVAILSSQNNNGILIRFTGLDRADCANVAQAVFQSGMIHQRINGAWKFLPPSPSAAVGAVPWTVSEINGFCTSPANNTVDVTYLM